MILTNDEVTVLLLIMGMGIIKTITKETTTIRIVMMMAMMI